MKSNLACSNFMTILLLLALLTLELLPFSQGVPFCFQVVPKGRLKEEKRTKCLLLNLGFDLQTSKHVLHIMD